MDQNNETKPNIPKTVDKWALASLAMQMGFIIALPLVAMAFLGKWLDAKYDFAPMFTLTGIFLAIITSTLWLMKKFKDFVK